MRLDHVNVRCTDLEATRRFFEDIVGLRVGPRPDFAFPGYWLYAGEQAVVHLVGSDLADAGLGKGTVDHFAFRGGDYEAQKAAIDRAGLKYRENDVPGLPLTQIFVAGPDGITVELQYETA